MARCKVIIIDQSRCSDGVSKGDFGRIHAYHLDRTIPKITVESGGKIQVIRASDVRVIRKRRKKIFKN